MAPVTFFESPRVGMNERVTNPNHLSQIVASMGKLGGND